MLNILEIHKKLNLTRDNGLFIKKQFESDNSSIQELFEGEFAHYKANYKIEYALKKLNPHSFFLFNNEPLLLFFDFSTTQEDISELSKKLWNFNKSVLIFINQPTELTIYNGFQLDKKSNLLEVLETITNIQETEKFEQFSYWKIVSAELWNEREAEFNKTQRVDTKLLENIRASREILIDPKNENPLPAEYANNMIARLIFARYLIDRKVSFSNYKKEGKELLNKTDLPNLILQKEQLFDFFEYLLNEFNGDILPLKEEKASITKHHLSVLSDLFAGNRIKTKQGSLFNIFDFDFIPIELVSNIYETFLGKKQKSDKAFYTPSFLVDYILEETVKPFIRKQTNADTLSCKVSDFTCGSGIFLCETLRTIIDKYIQLAQPDKSSEEFKEKIKQLLVDNIFGNDINQEATEIAKFSLFITLLDYLDKPTDIESFTFPDVSNNFYNQDVFATALKLNPTYKFESELDNIFGKGKKVELDFIIGNPPWGIIEGVQYVNYLKQREQIEKVIYKEKTEVAIGRKEFAQAFVLRLSDFATEKTENHVIINSKTLYNLNAQKFRNYFLKNYFVQDVLELSSVRHQIFAKAVGPAVIIKYKYAFRKETKDNLIQYISLKPNPYFALFKSILIEKYDYKEVKQGELIKNDWLWGVLVYGHILDYRFIERLRDKKEFSVTIDKLLKNNTSHKLKGITGVMIGNKSGDISEYKGMYYININTKETKRQSDLRKYYVHLHPQNTWQKSRAEGKRNKEAFTNPPILLIKQGLADYKLVASVSYISAVFTKSIYSIHSKDKDSSIIEILLGLVNSKLMDYFVITNCLSSVNERERLANEELFPFPIIENQEIADKAKKLMVLRRLIEIHKRKVPFNRDNEKIVKYQKQFEKEENELNKLILDLYKLSDTERDLMLYAQEITIPILQSKGEYKKIITRKKWAKPFQKVSEEDINDYIDIFKAHFSKIHQGEENGYFNVHIIQSKNAIGIEFSIDDEKQEDTWENSNTLDLLISLGFERKSNQLFTQKDVRVLKRRSFSIVKVNQYKYWHQAIARLDLIDFIETMIESRK